MKFKPCDPKLFFTKNDPDDPRLGDLVRPFSVGEKLEKRTVVIQGYPDDEGIKLNGGRTGAALAPTTIRKFIYKMTPALGCQPPLIRDRGDLDLISSLPERHRLAFESVKDLLNKKARVLSLGGGHDYGYSDCAAFAEVVLKEGKKPLIINFDAHLDARPDNKGENSGTSFYRLLRDYSKKIDFFEVGIQDWCNSSRHLQWVKDHGAHVITFEEINGSGTTLFEFLSKKIIKKIKPNHEVALSLDIDVFSSGASPGASQVFPVGIQPSGLLPFWKHLVSQKNPRLAAIYEVSPPFDQDDRTSRLAAIFAHQYIFS